MMISCFSDEVEKTVRDIKKIKNDDCLCFAILTDSKLTDYADETRENIKAVDKYIGFDCLIHLGNITNGDNPEKVTRYLMQEEIKKFRASTISQKLFVTLGSTDGYRDERYLGQLSLNMMTDEIWCEETAYIDNYENVERPEGKPYYYVDFPGKKTRMIFLCSYFYQMDKDIEYYEKYKGIDADQMKWLIKKALSGISGWNVYIFSHAAVKSRLDTGKDPFCYKGMSTEPFLSCLQQAQKRGININCCFSGAYGYDAEFAVEGVNFVSIASQAPYIIKNAVYKEADLYTDRSIGSLNQDCWDAVIIDNKKKAVNMIRFGCGNDRVINF